MRRLAAAGALAMCVVLGVAEAAAGAPQAGQRYDGESATGQRVHLVVSRDGKRLAKYVVAARLRCSDGRRRTMGLNHVNERPVPIDAQGSFANSPDMDRVRGARGRARVSFRGSFDASGDVASGTVDIDWRARRFRCKGSSIAFTAHRDGTPGAPFRDATLATGRYRAKAPGLDVRLRMFAPGRELRRGDLLWRARCRAGRLRGHHIYRLLVLEGASLDIRDRGTRRVAPGVVARERFRLRLRFSQRSGYVVDGTWTVTSRIFRGGRRIDTCRATRSFTGRGPA